MGPASECSSSLDADVDSPFCYAVANATTEANARRGWSQMLDRAHLDLRGVLRAVATGFSRTW